MPIRMKVYRQGKETLVAAADEDLIGKTFREDKFKIEVGAFYDGERVTEEELHAHLSFGHDRQLRGPRDRRGREEGRIRDGRRDAVDRGCPPCPVRRHDALSRGADRDRPFRRVGRWAFRHRRQTVLACFLSMRAYSPMSV